MAPYQYKVVPFLGQMRAGGDVGQVSAQLEGLINQHATSGWEFVNLDNVDIEVKPGCIAMLLGSKSSYMTFNQVIFRRSQ